MENSLLAFSIFTRLSIWFLAEINLANWILNKHKGQANYDWRLKSN